MSPKFAPKIYMGSPGAHAGKIMRRILRSIVKGEAITQDTSTLKDPSIVGIIKSMDVFSEKLEFYSLFHLLRNFQLFTGGNDPYLDMAVTVSDRSGHSRVNLIFFCVYMESDRLF